MIESFKTEIKFRLNENLQRIEKCLNLLNEEQVWFKPNENTNSIGNLILHLTGNIQQYANDGLSKSKDNRNRDLEFSTIKSMNKEELLQYISTAVTAACKSIERLSIEKLEEFYSIQGFNLTGVSVAVHITEHLSYHVGQITFTTKMITNKDLGFYGDLDLNITD